MARHDKELLRGTVDLLLLKALSLGPMHGWGIAERIERLSGEVYAVNQGAVYPALQRLLNRGLVVAEWRESEHNRQARYYKLTAAGRRQLGAELEWWRRASAGIERVLAAAPADC